MHRIATAAVLALVLVVGCGGGSSKKVSAASSSSSRASTTTSTSTTTTVADSTTTTALSAPSSAAGTTPPTDAPPSTAPPTEPSTEPPTTAPPTTAQPPFISIRNFAFSPTTLQVAPGTTVTVTNYDSATTMHSWTSDSGAFDSGTLYGPISSYSFTFTTPGTYAYHCMYHSTMHGTVVVS